MIAKISKGRNVTRLLYYLYGPGKSDEHTDPHLIAGWREPRGLEPPVRPDGKRDFRRLSSLLDTPLAMTGRAGKPGTVWHCVLAAAPGDKMLSDQQWQEIAGRFMDRIGLAPQDDAAGVRWVTVRHGLSRGGIDHVHIVATLARQDEKLPSVHNDFLRARRACQEVERRHGLISTAPADRTAAPRPSRAESERSAQNGRPEPPRTTLRRRIADAAAMALSEEDFFAQLTRDGVLIRLRYSEREPGRITGYAVALPSDVNRSGGPVWFSGGKLAPDLTIPKLRCRWERSGSDPVWGSSAERDTVTREFLRSAAMVAAGRARDEAGYFGALAAAGIEVRYRYIRPGEIVGYSLAMPDRSATAEKVWCSGGSLHEALTLPRLRQRWSASVTGGIRPPLTAEEHHALWDDVITVTRSAGDRVREHGGTGLAAADTAWATADLLRATARAVRGPAGRDLRRIADRFDRAAREAVVVVPLPTPAGDRLRAAARLVGVIGPVPLAGTIRRFTLAMTGLTDAVAELRRAQERDHQARTADLATAGLTRFADQAGNLTNPGSLVAAETAPAPHREHGEFGQKREGYEQPRRPVRQSPREPQVPRGHMP